MEIGNFSALTSMRLEYRVTRKHKAQRDDCRQEGNSCRQYLLEVKISPYRMVKMGISEYKIIHFKELILQIGKQASGGQ